ncbi:uncharacterized protein BO88DRAFT_389112 [Aspergillus vadensis CBS 113365]|uniref:Uncharacterized protein n=1 Tax=Aspergillus vadensis (strain CBS 113365 / IMI 142717 / IBT 24658) TaxID=1448311 RepID=A0A319BA68_ASPVC|nr:hypothetical protein BO88DRAFT_389112 [Aspergillus vadensis CBS 113365]PYH68831.1 hypothetical protein BO88DRAFT_389112 [Aspergillus vadensis CBS 113365]
MPPNTGKAIGDPSDDAYVAQVLAREARDSSLKYSAHGLEAYMPKRPTGAAPKPNTRFLRHIIRETDNHNTALKRKEEREARERMRQLRNQASSSSANDANRDQRRSRLEGNIGVVRHRRREANRIGADGGVTLKTPMTTGIDPREGVVATDLILVQGVDPRNTAGMLILAAIADDIATAMSRHDHVRGPQEHLTGAGLEIASAGVTAEETPLDDESDPLEDLVGPLPAKDNDHGYSAPIRSRGRGAYKPNVSNIDAHFAPDYDPSTDVHLEDDDGQAGSRPTRRPVAGLMTGDDDWELSLEALRDRAKWKQRGEERLREAGFSNEFVDRWKSNTTSTPGDDSEGRLEDVKWSKKGEGREWDRGKFVDQDGHIDVKASW